MTTKLSSTIGVSATAAEIFRQVLLLLEGASRHDQRTVIANMLAWGARTEGTADPQAVLPFYFNNAKNILQQNAEWDEVVAAHNKKDSDL